MPAETHSIGERTISEALLVVHERVGDLLGIAPDQVHDDTELPDDALALVELLEGIEEDLGERTVGISDDESEDWVYVRDVVASVTNLLAQ